MAIFKIPVDHNLENTESGTCYVDQWSYYSKLKSTLSLQVKMIYFSHGVPFTWKNSLLIYDFRSTNESQVHLCFSKVAFCIILSEAMSTEHYLGTGRSDVSHE